MRSSAEAASVSYRLACRIRAIHGIAADMVVGSMSVHCAYYAGDPPLEGIERLGTIWRGLRRSLAGEIVAPISVMSVSTVTPPSMPTPRFRALALFGRRPQHRVDSVGIPASKNLHKSRP
jgi:hypothetical protein